MKLILLGFIYVLIRADRYEDYIRGNLNNTKLFREAYEETIRELMDRRESHIYLSEHFEGFPDTFGLSECAVDMYPVYVFRFQKLKSIYSNETNGLDTLNINWSEKELALGIHDTCTNNNKSQSSTERNSFEFGD